MRAERHQTLYERAVTTLDRLDRSDTALPFRGKSGGNQPGGTPRDQELEQPPATVSQAPRAPVAAPIAQPPFPQPLQGPLPGTPLPIQAPITPKKPGGGS